MTAPTADAAEVAMTADAAAEAMAADAAAEAISTNAPPTACRDSLKTRAKADRREALREAGDEQLGENHLHSKDSLSLWGDAESLRDTLNSPHAFLQF